MSKKSVNFQTILEDFKLFFRDLFNLHEDEANEKATIKDIKDDVAFRGANLWILIFAIIVCSVGLDINSTAVVIGAMLISPLMGPIMGIGLGIGIYDFELIKRGMKNLGIAVVVSVLASALYFWISPLDLAQSELLARTSPTLWDVFIALFGGMAGIIAGSRKEKSNAIPGVAIATALMPPLCTAGFGLASLQWEFFLGAMYLFFINSVFISLSTYLIVLLLGYSKKEFLDPKRKQSVKNYITFIVLLAILPSIYTGYNLVRKTIFNKNANLFLNEKMAFENSYIINKNLIHKKDSNRIEVTLYGEPIPLEIIEELKKELPNYNIENTELIVRQGFQAELDKPGIDLATIQQMNQQLRSGIIEDLYKKNEERLKSKDDQIALLEQEVMEFRSKEIPMDEIIAEIRAINLNINQLSVSPTILSNTDSLTHDTIMLAYANFKKPPKRQEIRQLEDWLKARLKVGKLKLVNQ